MKFQVPRGTRDILPPDSDRWAEIEAQARRVLSSYGYREVRTPIFESTELFVRSVGESTDIVRKELYTFTDRGDRSLTLRPEGTAPLVRAYPESSVLRQETPARLDNTILAPTRVAMDFSSYEQVESYCRDKFIDVMIHAGAVTNKFTEDADEAYIRSNIIGTANIALWCRRKRIRLVYISSDYVYPGEVGNYSEESVVFPVNRYALSKLGGELSVRLHDNSLIIRTSFYSSLNFDRACHDQFTSRIPLNIAASAIYRLALMDHVQGILNVGSPEKRSMYEIVREEFNRNVAGCYRKDGKS